MSVCVFTCMHAYTVPGDVPSTTLDDARLSAASEAERDALDTLWEQLWGAKGH